MGVSLGGEVLIGVAIEIVVAALCFLSVRLWNCLMKLINTQTTVGESPDDQSFPDSASAANANGVRDLELGNGNGPAQGGESVTEPEVELVIVNNGEGREHFSNQEAHTPGIKSPVITPEAHDTRDAAREARVQSVEMDVPHSQQAEVSPWSCSNVSCVPNVPSPDDPTSLSYTASILEGLTI